MQELTKTLDELKGLHEKILGHAAPELVPDSFIPFPVGVDPIEHALAEARHLSQLAERVAFAPKSDAWIPPADSFVADDHIIVRVEIPGVSREDVNVNVVGGECIIRGERKRPQCAEDARPMKIERPWGAFERRFTLPTGSRVGEIKARCVDGVLELNIPIDSVELPKEQVIKVG
jgi:HSP20 family protein